jgi:ribosome-binding protein aMBF1 (putative translation factor)
MSKWSDFLHGKQSCSFCGKNWKSSQIRTVDTGGSKVLVTVCEECVAAGYDITKWPIDPNYRPHQDDGAADK